MKGLKVVVYHCNNCEKSMFLDEETVKENEGQVNCPFCGDGDFLSSDDFDAGYYTLA